MSEDKREALKILATFAFYWACVTAGWVVLRAEPVREPAPSVTPSRASYANLAHVERRGCVVGVYVGGKLVSQDHAQFDCPASYVALEEPKGILFAYRWPLDDANAKVIVRDELVPVTEIIRGGILTTYVLGGGKGSILMAPNSVNVNLDDP